MPSSRTISANGIDIFLLEQGQGPMVVLCHGWPELSYSWRHQIPAIGARRGEHAQAACCLRYFQLLERELHGTANGSRKILLP